MTELNSIFFLNAIYFILAAFLAFYIPGNLILKKLKLSLFQESILSVLVGINFWAWQGFISGYLQQRWLSYLYLLLTTILWTYHLIQKRGKKEKVLSSKIKKQNPDPRTILKNNWLVIALILTGTIIQVFPVWFMGVYLKGGIVSCCGFPPDNMLELAIVQELVHRFPPFEPGMYGTYLQNYHYWGHLVIAELARVFHLPVVATTYQYFSIIIALFLGLVSIVCAQLLGCNKKYTSWLLFFLYFGGDATYLLMAFLHKTFSMQVSGLENGASFLMNYPRAISIVMFFTGFCLFLLWQKNRNFLTGILTAIIFGSLIGFKVYTGIFALSGLSSVMLYSIWRKQWKTITPFILATILAIIIYYPVNKNAGGLFFVGTWRFEDFIVQKPLGLSHLELAYQIYQQHHNIPRIIEYTFLFAVLYIIAMFGTKLFGLIQTKKSLSYFPTETNIFLISACILNTILGLFFLQKSGGANTFNFLVEVFIIGSVYTALAAWYWMSKIPKTFQVIYLGIVILLTIPRTISIFTSTYTAIAFIQPNITKSEIAALQYLRTQTPSDSLILTDRNIAQNVLTPYVAYMADRPQFLAGEGNELGSHGINFTQRLHDVNEIEHNKNPNIVKALLKKHEINYLYLLTSTHLGIPDNTQFLITVFHNNTIKILKFQSQ